MKCVGTSFDDLTTPSSRNQNASDGESLTISTSSSDSESTFSLDFEVDFSLDFWEVDFSVVFSVGFDFSGSSKVPISSISKSFPLLICSISSSDAFPALFRVQNVNGPRKPGKKRNFGSKFQEMNFGTLTLSVLPLVNCGWFSLFSDWSEFVPFSVIFGISLTQTDENNSNLNFDSSNDKDSKINHQEIRLRIIFTHVFSPNIRKCVG